MRYYTVSPSAELSPYVRYFWVLEGEASPDTPYVHRSMADGCAELVFHYQGTFDELFPDRVEQSFDAGLAGQSTRFRRFQIEKNFGIFGVYFFPYAIPELFSIGGGEIVNQMLDLKTVLGKQGEELHERMALSTDNTERLKVVSTFLEAKIRRSVRGSNPMHHAIRHLVNTNGQGSVSKLAEDTFQSTRQFQRNFKHLSGFTPKTFLRIIRFQHAIGQYHQKEKSLSTIALDCGYYDQSHFIQDFRSFSGLTPRQYFSGETEATQWRD